MHPLHVALIAAATGRFPSVDGEVEVHRPPPGGQAVVAEFTGHAFVLTERDPEAFTQLEADAFGGVSQPDVLRWLAGPNGLVGSHDVVLVAQGRGGASTRQETLPRRDDLDLHPRVGRARQHRRDVVVHGDDRGFVTLGHGVVGRLEMSVEVTGGPHGAGVGRALIEAGMQLVNRGALVWAQVAPGNAASLRAFLSCGFTPIGAETLIEPDRSERVGRDMSHSRHDQSRD